MDKTNQTSEYLLRLAIVNELRDAVSYKRQFEDLVNSFLGLYGEFINYCKANGIDIPDLTTHDRILERVRLTISPIVQAITRCATCGEHHPSNQQCQQLQPNA